MRIILNASVSTVKRLRVSLGTLVAIEATAGGPVGTTSGPAGTSGGSAATSGGTAATSGGTAVAPGAPAGAASTAEAAMERAFAAIEHVYRLMHPHTQFSDLARINGAPLNVPIKVHPSVGQLLKLARRISALTAGVFDPCTPARPGRLADIEVSEDDTEVVCRAPVALDFGGFAKGYAVDCAIEALVAGGCTAGLVNAGGDLRVFGPRTEPVFLRQPNGKLTPIEITNAALAVSDASATQRPPEHQGYYVHKRTTESAEDQHATQPPAAAHATQPLAVPRANRPLADQYSTQPSIVARANQPLPLAHSPEPLAATYAAVVASTAAVADALAKCVLLCPAPSADRVLRAFGATQLPPAAANRFSFGSAAGHSQ